MICLEIDELPPTSNHAYFNTGRGRVLTKDGQSFKTRCKKTLSTKYNKEMGFFKPNVGYDFLYVFHCTEMFNASYKPGGTVKLYKEFDATNRVKLIEDCIQEIGGYNDAQNESVLVHKKQDTKDKTCIWVWMINEEGNRVRELLQQVCPS